LTGLAIVSTAPAVQSAEQSAVAGLDKAALDRAIRDYILGHPEIIGEALEKLRENQRLAAEAEARKALAGLRATVFQDASSPIGGNPQGDVVLVEFFDYRCGVCKTVFPFVEDLLREDGQIKFVYKEWPILGPASVYASRAALASHFQGKYQVFHDALMQAKGDLTQARVVQIAGQVGVDVERLVGDMNKPEIDKIIRRNYQLAQDLRIDGTPTFILGDKIVKGGRSLEDMKSLVAEARAKKE
jgi:protein-disulfide isomerase